MKRSLMAAAAMLLLTAGAADAQVKVRGYTKADGTYVAPHYRSSPNSTTLDNYSTRGNVNPYTGEVGTKSPYPNYSAPRTTYTPSYTPSYPPLASPNPNYQPAPPAYQPYSPPQTTYPAYRPSY